MRTMFDGINSDAFAIHRDFPNAELVAGYVNGAFAWSAADWNLFPHAVHVGISVTASANAGDVLDVEAGDALPSQTEGWIAKRKAAGLFRPTIYCTLSAVPAVRAGTGRYVLGVDYDLWVADWDGSSAVPYAHAAAKQNRSTNSYDVSVVYDAAWPHRSPAPKPPVPPKPPAPPAPGLVWPAGVLLREGSTGNAVRALQTAFRDSGIHLVGGITADGKWGPQTNAACLAFERAEHLTVDAGGHAVAGPQVRAALVRIGRLTPAGAPVA